jgi:NTP pyrophosphatase (non-canonical NTP hydrolase)
MNLSNEFQPIRQWADDKGIYSKGDVKTQLVKLIEEVGELAKAILKNDEAEVCDGIGDCSVVLTNIAELASIHFKSDITMENCINDAYDIIAKRKGKMENGTFVKD